MSSTNIFSATHYCNGLMFLYGVSIVMIGTIIPELIQTFEITLSRVGFILTIQCMGGIFALVLVTLTVDHINKTPAIPISFGSLGLGLFLVGQAPNFLLVLLAFFFCGIFIRILDVLLNAFIGELHQEKSGRYLNRLHMYFSIGAFFGPLYAGLLLDLGMAWNQIYILTGMIFMFVSIPGYWVLRSLKQFSPKLDEKENSTIQLMILLHKPELWLLGIILLFYAFHQLSVTAWLPYYMENSLHTSKLYANMAVSIFWLGIIAGRFIASLLVEKKSAAKLLLWGEILGGIVLLLGIFSNDFIVTILAFLFAGLTTGAVIPLVMTICYGLFPANTGSATSFLSFFLLMGQMIGPWFLGITAEIITMHNAIFLTAITLFGCTVAGGISEKIKESC